jgi:Protein of unknown function (DUF3305)
MAREDLTVGVVVERRTLDNPWIDHAWLPSAILPGAPAVEAWTTLSEQNGVRQVYAGPHMISFFSTDTGHYRDNLLSGSPKIWVSLRRTDGEPPVSVVGVTADPAEGEAFTEAGDDIVEALAMPAQLGEQLAQFIQTHHVERSFQKRRRDEADPEAMAAKPGHRGSGTGDDGHE